MKIVEEPLFIFLLRFPAFRDLLPVDVVDHPSGYVVKYREDLSMVELGFPDDDFLIA